MILSLSKIIIYYIILYFTFKIIKEKVLKKKNIKISDFYCNKSVYKEEDADNEDIKNEYALIPYKHKKKSKITLEEVYDNFFNNKETKIEENIDLNLFNLVKINKEAFKKDNIILNETKENLILEVPQSVTASTVTDDDML